MENVKDYLVQNQENGHVLIAPEVISSVAAMALREVDGVYGLSMTSSFDLTSILGKKNLRGGIRVELTDEGVCLSCNLVVMAGSAVVTVAKAVQDTIADQLESVVGVRPLRVDVNVCGVAIPKEK